MANEIVSVGMEEQVAFLEGAVITETNGNEILLASGIVVSDISKYRDALLREVVEGAASPRAREGVLQKDIRELNSLILAREFKKELEKARSSQEVRRTSLAIASKKGWIQERERTMLLGVWAEQHKKLKSTEVEVS